VKAPTLDRAAVLRLAELAQLRIDDSRVDDLVRDLERIVAYATELADVDTTGVAPMERPAHAATAAEERGRADEPQAELEREALFAEAPRVEASGFSVPAFVDEG
jgi:aspartyl-tRNA(Asn)/glutamyl-tRNA(Gln) amidotransferase subunit C